MQKKENTTSVCFEMRLIIYLYGIILEVGFSDSAMITIITIIDILTLKEKEAYNPEAYDSVGEPITIYFLMRNY